MDSYYKIEYSALIKLIDKCLLFNRHADREAEPKNYDVTKSDIDERDLLRATYNRIGNITDGVSFMCIVSMCSISIDNL